jgi:hypothetical protein
MSRLPVGLRPVKVISGVALCYSCLVNLPDAIAILRQLRRDHPKLNKAELEDRFLRKVGVRKERSVFVGQGYAIRFSEANTGSFSNVVLSLSALRKYDASPMVICVVRPDRLDFRLANATFLKRISHSSHKFRTDNIRGSFLGHDISAEYLGIPNRPERFDELFAAHSVFTWEENIDRLVEATNSIVARATRFDVTPAKLAIILDAPQRASVAMNTDAIRATERQLASIVARYRGDILLAAKLENVNLRGNTIERIITGAVNEHRLDDISFDLPRGGRLIVDVKTKLLDRASAPKAYNIDKMLNILADPANTFAFFFLGLDVARSVVHFRLVSLFDRAIVEATRIQTHWAGRASRGVTQLIGNLGSVFEPNYAVSIDIEAAKLLLRRLVER